MSLQAIEYVTTRGLNDAKWLFGEHYDAEGLQEEWEEAIALVKSDRRRTLSVFCESVDDVASQLRGIETERFTNPNDIIKRTRTLVSAVEVITKMRDGKILGNPHDIESVAKNAGVATEDIHHAISTLFMVANPSYEALLDCCDVKTDVPDVSPEMAGEYDENVDEICLLSFQKKRTLTDEEAEEYGYSDANELKRHMQEWLFSDLRSAIDYFTSKGWNINVVALNQHSHYFREYGIDIYNLWFDGDLAKVTDHPRPEVGKLLKEIFNPNLIINRSKLGIDWCDIPDDLIEKLKDVGYGERLKVSKMIENCFGFKFKRKMPTVFNTHAAIAVLEFWKKHGLTFTPFMSWFTLGSQHVKQKLARLERLMEIADELNLPFRIRVQLYQSGITLEKLEKRMRFYEQNGIHPDYYGPYLMLEAHTPHEQAVRSILTTVCAERCIPHAPDRRHYKKLTRRNTRRMSPDRIYALEYLANAGCHYEDFNYNTPLAPELLAKKAKLYIEAGIPDVGSCIGSHTIEATQQKISKLTDGSGRTKCFERGEYEEGEYEEVIKERGLVLPTYYDGIYTKFAIVQRIYLIESCGLPFTKENLDAKIVHWSWINLSPIELQRKIYKQWAKLHHEDKWKELCETYGLDENILATCVKRKPSDSVWEYMRLLTKSDIDVSSIRISIINQMSPERFRDYLYRLLEKNPPTTPQQRLFMQKYETAEFAQDSLGWKDAHLLIDLLSQRELEKAKRAIKGGGKKAKDHYKELQVRREQFESVKARLLYTRAKYRAIEDLMENIPIDELQQKINIFDRAKIPINTELLYCDPEEIESILYGDTEILDDEK